MESRENHWVIARFEDLAQQGSDAERIADIIVLNWQLTETILNPILGRKSATMLYQRSLFLTTKIYPWLISAYGGIASSMDLAALKIVVIQQSSADAAAAGGAFLQIFHDMLTSLIGSAFTENSLRSVWEHHLSGPSARDTSP